jgi:hypothetical protein
VREDVEATGLLTVVAALPAQFRDADGSSEFLDVILRGLMTESATRAARIG